CGRFRLRPDVGKRGGILSHEQDAQEREHAPPRKAFRGDASPLADRAGHGAAVQNDCRGSGIHPSQAYLLGWLTFTQAIACPKGRAAGHFMLNWGLPRQSVSTPESGRGGGPEEDRPHGAKLMRKRYAALRTGLLTTALVSAHTLVSAQDFNEALL